MTKWTGAVAAFTLAALAASPALAFRGGGGSSSGGDREPAGGAFMSSYTYPGSTGDQAYGPPRSVDIPRNGYVRPDYYVPPRQAPMPRYYYER